MIDLKDIADKINQAKSGTPHISKETAEALHMIVIAIGQIDERLKKQGA
jgi:hypothetical protein